MWLYSYKTWILQQIYQFESIFDLLKLACWAFRKSESGLIQSYNHSGHETDIRSDQYSHSSTRM